MGARTWYKGGEGKSGSRISITKRRRRGLLPLRPTERFPQTGAPLPPFFSWRAAATDRTASSEPYGESVVNVPVSAMVRLPLSSCAITSSLYSVSGSRNAAGTNTEV